MDKPLHLSPEVLRIRHVLQNQHPSLADKERVAARFRFLGPRAYGNGVLLTLGGGMNPS